MRSELDAHHSTSMEQERDIEVTRLELQEAKREGAERARILEGEALRYEQAVAQHAHQVELLKGDCLKFQATARTAHGSYERELQLHATAERELKNAEAGAFMYALLLLRLLCCPSSGLEFEAVPLE